MKSSATKRRKAAPTPRFTGPIDDISITFIGHPWAPIGMGEQMRSHIAALSALHMRHGVFDIFRYAARTDISHDTIIGTRETRELPGGIRIFHVNGDEVGPVFAAFEARGGVLADGYNIVVPAWELPTYPTVYAKELKRFDEVWVLSHFIRRRSRHPASTATGSGRRSNRCQARPCHDGISASARAPSCC